MWFLTNFRLWKWEKKLFYDHKLALNFLNSRWGSCFQFDEHPYDPLVVAGMKRNQKKQELLNIIPVLSDSKFSLFTRVLGNYCIVVFNKLLKWSNNRHWRSQLVCYYQMKLLLLYLPPVTNINNYWAKRPALGNRFFIITVLWVEIVQEIDLLGFAVLSVSAVARIKICTLCKCLAPWSKAQQFASECKLRS